MLPCRTDQIEMIIIVWKMGENMIKQFRDTFK